MFLSVAKDSACLPSKAHWSVRGHGRETKSGQIFPSNRVPFQTWSPRHQSVRVRASSDLCVSSPQGPITIVAINNNNKKIAIRSAQENQRKLPLGTHKEEEVEEEEEEEDEARGCGAVTAIVGSSGVVHFSFTV